MTIGFLSFLTHTEFGWAKVLRDCEPAGGELELKCWFFVIIGG